MGQSREVGTYDPRELHITVAGSTVTGYADGTVIAISRASDSFTKYVGTDGIVARSRNVDTSGEIVISLAMNSSSNDFFSTLFNIDEKTGKGAFPIIVKNAGGRDVISGAVAWFRKPADVGFSKEIETREWTIDVAHMEVFIGGSSDITP